MEEGTSSFSVFLGWYFSIIGAYKRFYLNGFPMCLGFKAVIIKHRILGRNYYINWLLNLNWSCFTSPPIKQIGHLEFFISVYSFWVRHWPGRLCPVSDEITLALNLHGPWLQPLCHSVILWNCSIHWWRLTGFYVLGQ